MTHAHGGGGGSFDEANAVNLDGATQDAVAAFGANYPDFVGTDTGDAIEAYTREKYAYINGYLRGTWQAPPASEVGFFNRGKSKEGIETSVRQMDDAMRPLPHDMVLHRGMSIDWDSEDIESPIGSMFKASGDQAVGRLGVDDGFLSASLTKDITQIKEGEIYVQLHVPKGTPSIWAQPHAQYKSEQEVILGRGSTLRVKSYEVVGTQERYVVEVVNP